MEQPAASAINGRAVLAAAAEIAAPFLEQELAEITGKKQEALTAFDTVTRTIIYDEIWNNSKEKIDSLTEDLERRENRQRTLEKQIEEMSLEITDR